MHLVQKQKIRLLIAIDFFYPHWTGLAKAMYYFIQRFEDRFSMTVLTVKHEKDLPTEDYFHKTRIIRASPLFWISRAAYSLESIAFFASLVRKHDVVFLHSPCVHIVPFTLMTKLVRKKLIIFHHGDLILPKGIRNRLIEKMFDLSSFVSFALADTVSTYTNDYAENSRVLKPFLKKFKPFILPITLSQKREPIAHFTAVRKEKKLLFGFAGRFVEEKGFDILFQAIPLIKKEYPDVHFVFAGEKQMHYENFFAQHAESFEKIKKHITFLGLLTQEQLITFYTEIDAIIVPSRSDCFSLVQAEAMLCGTPAVVSDIPGLRYPVRESGFGLLVKPEDPYDLAAKIIQFVHQKHAILKTEKRLRIMLQDKQHDEEAITNIIG